MQAGQDPHRRRAAATRFGTAAQIGTQFDAIAPIRLVRRIDCPVLFVHGAGDTSVPLADAQRLSGACPRGELLIVDGDHDLRGALAPHTARIVDFLRSATAARSD